VTTLILVIILLAAFAVVWWGVGRLTLPEPIKTVVLVILALVVLFAIYQWIASGKLSSVLPS
jgi:hypothetical protein